ncbi:MAG: aromatic ring-hydroxylating dioxygenase subunit alpha [Candidatus Neomarinimicrobiota bacterium]
MKFHKTAETLTKGAKTLPQKFYTQSEILNQEYKKIFHNNWICIGRDSDLINKGQYITIQLGSESVIVLKSEKDKIKAFFNVCRHRGTRICNQSQGSFSKTIQCPYHGWTYDLNGKLVGSPHMDTVNDFNKINYPLFPIETKEWKGFLFINLSETPENFNEIFKPIR